MTGVLAILGVLGCLAVKWLFSIRLMRLRKTLEKLRGEDREMKKELVVKAQERAGLEHETRKTKMKIGVIGKNTSALAKTLEDLRAIEQSELEILKNQKELLANG